MAEQTYQEYRQSRLTPPVEAEPEPTTETPPEAEAAPLEAEPQDSPPADDVDDLDDEVEEDPQPAAAKRKRRTEQRFRRLQDRARRAERENAELKGRLDTLERLVTQAGDKAPPGEPAQPTGRPRRDDYTDYEDYVEAVADWKAEEKIQAELVRQRNVAAEAARRAEAESRQTTYGERLDAARARYDDYDDVVDSSDIRISEDVTSAILESEVGPDVVYYLAQHPAEAEKLNRMSAVALGKALARIEDQVTPQGEEADEEPPPAPPQPPAPIRPVSGGGNAPAGTPPDQMSYQDYKKARRAGRIR